MQTLVNWSKKYSKDGLVVPHCQYTKSKVTRPSLLYLIISINICSHINLNKCWLKLIAKIGSEKINQLNCILIRRQNTGVYLSYCFVRLGILLFLLCNHLLCKKEFHVLKPTNTIILKYMSRRDQYTHCLLKMLYWANLWSS